MEIVKQYQVSIQQACRIMDLSRSVFYYQPKRESDEIIIQAINQLHERYPFIGFWQIFHRLRQQGYHWNHKRVLRIYRSLKLKLTIGRPTGKPTQNAFVERFNGTVRQELYNRFGDPIIYI